MLKNVKAKNEKIIKEHFEEVFGEGYVIEVKWGMPVCNIMATFNKDGKKSIWNLIFDMENSNFELRTFSTKMVEGVEQPDWAQIDNQTINFIINRAAEISENLFFTRDVPEQPVPQAPAPQEPIIEAEAEVQAE
jgi:hypothetical protein